MLHLSVRDNPPAMHIGILRETWPGEGRVAVSPSAARALRAAGAHVLVEQNAGAASGWSDDAYIAAGADIVPTAEEIFHRSDLLVKVMPLDAHERTLLRPSTDLWDLARMAAAAPSVRAASSEIAGRLAVEAASHALQAQAGGRGLLLGGVPGVDPAEVVILGVGVAGSVAALLAHAMGASVRVLDTDVMALRALRGVPSRVATPHAVERALATADVVIAAVRDASGGRAPRLATRAHLALMQPGAVVVDLAIDAELPDGGGAFESTPVTTLEDPAREVDGIVHVGVPNFCGGVPRTSSPALSQAALPLLVAQVR